MLASPGVRPSAFPRCATARRCAATALLSCISALFGGVPAAARAAAPAPGTASAPGPGQILGLRARPDAGGSLVEVLSDRPLSFTTLRLNAPARVVLDFADAEIVSGVPAEQEVEDGTVRRIGAATAGARTARVVIELAGEVEFDVRSAGPRLEVRLARARRPVASATPAGEDDAAGPASGRAAPGASPSAVAQEQAVPLVLAAAPEAAPGDGSSAPAAARIEAPPAPAPPRIEVPPSPAALGIEAPPSPAVARVESPRVARDPARDAAEALREREKRASLPTVSIAGPGAAAPSAGTAAAAPRVADAPPALAAGSEQVAPVSSGGAAGRAPSAGPPPEATAAHGPRRPAAISGIGFKPQGQGVVLVRSDRAVEYSVTRSDREVLLHLAAATISVANNRRPLDTRFFGGPVERIVPVASAAGTELRIELRESAEFEVQQTAGLLTVTFTR